MTAMLVSCRIISHSLERNASSIDPTTDPAVTAILENVKRAMPGEPKLLGLEAGGGRGWKGLECDYRCQVCDGREFGRGCFPESLDLFQERWRDGEGGAGVYCTNTVSPREFFKDIFKSV